MIFFQSRLYAFFVSYQESEIIILAFCPSLSGFSLVQLAGSSSVAKYKKYLTIKENFGISLFITFLAPLNFIFKLLIFKLLTSMFLDSFLRRYVKNITKVQADPQQGCDKFLLNQDYHKIQTFSK
ncbi:hypothetical protein BZZ01_16505 [Nostocales cyanobacterium HT-58-2]|nr:hypothetical protein BZZ01_16505 [Nostocales cyanobacterium HT-58-2]